MAKQVVSIGDTGQQLVNKLENNFNELYQNVAENTKGITTFREKLDSGQLKGEDGTDGINGVDGKDATINGLNILNIIDGANTVVEIYVITLKINAEIEGQFNWRGPFQLGNMYNKNDIVMGEDGSDYIAIMDGLVLPPPSMGWDLFLGGSRDFSRNPINLESEITGREEQLKAINSGITSEWMEKINIRLTFLETESHIDFDKWIIYITPGDIIDVAPLLDLESLEAGETFELLFEFIKNGGLAMTDLDDNYEGDTAYYEWFPNGYSTEQIKEIVRQDMLLAFDEPVTPQFEGSVRGMARMFFNNRGAMTTPEQLDVRSGRFKIICHSNNTDHLWIVPSDENSNRTINFGWNGDGADNNYGGADGIIMDNNEFEQFLNPKAPEKQFVWYWGSKEGCVIKLISKSW